MQFKIVRSATLAACLFIASIPIFCQVVPQATAGHLPFTVGGGVSSYDVDWGHGRMYGGTIWADWHPDLSLPLLNGLGLEIEARDVSLDRGDHPTNFRQDTAGGGLIYTWSHYRNFRPYGKYLLQLGSMDFKTLSPDYSHDTYTVYSPGLGVDFRLFRNVWGRVDYEYQFWPDVLGKTSDPQGFTLGAVYDFGRRNRALGR